VSACPLIGWTDGLHPPSLFPVRMAGSTVARPEADSGRTSTTFPNVGELVPTAHWRQRSDDSKAGGTAWNNHTAWERRAGPGAMPAPQQLFHITSRREGGCA
jgi:hypothetical protein